MIKILASLCLILAANAVAQTPKVLKQTKAHTSNSWSGDQLYKEFCAVCHGIDGKGNGPAASALKAPPTDLTQFSRRNNNKYNDLKMRNIIGNTDAVGASGPADCPGAKWQFYQLHVRRPCPVHGATDRACDRCTVQPVADI